MRLTLRTLLAYLDDTLDPAQTRAIGQKVAESDMARELVDRIRKVTRKRALTVPPADKADANVVAKYLDNDLQSEQVAEVEEQALHSEVHLAEIAACHQLLTLIMSEPASVPPSARLRMYGLVKGPEVDPNRQAPRVASATLAPEGPLAEEEEINPLVSRRGGKKRLMAAGFLSLLLIGAVWMTIKSTDQPKPSPRSNEPVAENKVAPRDEPKATPKNDVVEPTNPPAEKTTPPMPNVPQEKAPVTETPKEKMPPSEQPKEAAPKSEPPKPAEPPVEDLAASRKTSDERIVVGKLSGANGLLIQSTHDGADWQRVAPNSDLTGLSRLLSLPGVTNEVRIGDALLVEVVGQLPEVQPDVATFESVIRTFAPPKGFDGDLRVERGRIYVRAAKPAGAKLRLRMGDDVLDVVFTDDQSEIIADLAGATGVMRGQVKVRPNLRPEMTMKAAPGPALLLWQSGGGWADKPVDINEPVPVWSKTRTYTGPGRELAQEMDGLVKRLPKLLGDPKKDLKLSVSELAYDRSPLGRRLGLYCEAALDNLPPLIDALEDQANPESRSGAVIALQHWLLRSPDHSAKLQEGLITRKGMSNAQASRILTLFHGFDETAQRDPKTYARLIEELCDDRLAIRELSHWRLCQLDPESGRAIRYLPTDSNDAQQRARAEWKRRIPDGAVPARPRL